MYTSHYEPSRSFSETRHPNFHVAVAGDWLPRAIFGKLHIIFAVLRQLVLALWVAVAQPAMDVYIVDQVSAAVPVLQWLRPRSKVVFYCHFPDQLLADHSSIVKRIYRAPFDWFEATTTAAAHTVVVNSKFTRAVTQATVPALRDRPLEVLYPCIQFPATPAPAYEYVAEQCILPQPLSHTPFPCPPTHGCTGLS